MGYFRIDISGHIRDTLFLIPTIEISKWSRGIEITFYILCLELYATISTISEENYEP